MNENIDKNMWAYNALAEVPKDALSTISFGALKGKSDINPQWRIEAMTRQYGPCGIGWRFDVIKTETVPCPDGQLLLFMTVTAQVKVGENWSEAVTGYGGDFIIKMEKGQLKPNDEAYKMAETDALGNALKYFGVAANVYRGINDSKYQKQASDVSKANDASKQTNKQAQPKQADKSESLGWTKQHAGKTCVLVQGKYYYLENLKKEQLKVILNNANYKAVHEEAQKLLEAA